MTLKRPDRIATPWASAKQARVAAIPERTTDAQTVSGRASWAMGFPPITMTAVQSGGRPPWGIDHNGILQELSRHIQWSNAGGLASYDFAFARATGGYPKGVLLQGQNPTNPWQMWMNEIEGNITDPDSSEASGWSLWPQYAPDPADTDSSASIATTEWVQRHDFASKSWVTEGNYTINGPIHVVTPSLTDSSTFPATTEWVAKQDYVTKQLVEKLQQDLMQWVRNREYIKSAIHKSGEWKVPQGVSRVIIELFAGGGGGGGSTGIGACASGGGGGGYARCSLKVKEGEKIPIIIGEGGKGGAPGRPGKGGGATYVIENLYVNGGDGGEAGVNRVSPINTNGGDPYNYGGGHWIGLSGGVGQAGRMVNNIYFGGSGGSSYGMLPPPPTLGVGDGMSSNNVGTGGAGAAGNNYTGGNGGAGQVFISWFA